MNDIEKFQKEYSEKNSKESEDVSYGVQYKIGVQLFKKEDEAKATAAKYNAIYLGKVDGHF
jgi:hypothetical protein